jgi:two-component system response regulator PilR (NtrC family)
VRILSASHRDLGALVAEGRFRQDLFFRINVITLSVPPLRERREDIPDLAAHILARLAEREGGGRRELSAPALSLLVSQPLPGNVRELENLLERACALCEGDQIGLEDFNLPYCELDETEVETPLTRNDSNECIADNEERQLILSTLDETRWNRSEAARRLGLTLRQLRYRLEKWGVE